MKIEWSLSLSFDCISNFFLFRDLIRLDSTNVTDANIIFAAHATVHPLEHASILAVRDAHYEDTGNYFYVYNY